ncbi:MULTISPECIES: outer membrane protein assembly factor BamA [Halomonas]|uniref:Outer membrane protein assembly factor BamA n=1 Tax=Halomonas halophila TaxID=29573 RepID=A0ABQ0U2C8_9GAMM|nr:MULTISPECIES: outer membrane protein assembly factor BamA [Halomonas]MDR5890018.1 outer membrane protein assembly factor BamA [Halomonas salina]WJY06878.1 outer membrane protein assembly factor BamA [Halomonas halophila]GEK72698.1 outer membrane protein assembly factor BamA [Halomonas halophila]
MKIKTIGLAALLLAGAGTAQAETFDVKDIRVEGLQRVSAASVFNAFPVNAPDRVDDRELAEAARQLFATGLFEDIQLARDGDVLIIEVEERPTITSLNIEGNSQIPEEELRRGLREAGLDEGQVLQLSTLEEIQRELSGVYQAQGRYSASIDTEVQDLGQGRVQVDIDIDEGAVAKIRQINIVGNQAFDDDTLRDVLELEDKPGWFFGWFSSDEYSRQALSGDLERLRSYYLDRGYVNFTIDSTQVSIGPDKSKIFITINVSEGERYRLGDIAFAGDLRIPEREARDLLEVQSGETFSRSDVTASSEALRSRLGAEGFAFANVDGIPETRSDGTVDLTFRVEPGSRAYVRRIEFVGNTTTQDEVLRREMIQMEGAPASTESISQSRERLERLGFFKQVEVQTEPVAGSNDQLDVTYNVEEQPSGSISASIGFSQSAGVIYGASLSQNNFLGTGNRVNIGAQRSDTYTNLNFGFTDPYWTLDGISRGYNLFYRETDYEDSDISTYSTDAYGGGINFGYPINELTRLNFGADIEDLTIETYRDTASEIQRYVDDQGDNAQAFKLTASWTRNALNRGIMPTAGNYQRLSLETAVPGSDAEYYKLRARARHFFPINEEQTWSFKLRGEVGYADSIGNDPYPFYENFYTGGLGSVRGFTSNTLGPNTTPPVGGDADEDRTLGGNVLVEGGAELIFPMPFVEDKRSVQPSVFVDAGNTFLTDCYAVRDEEAGQSSCSSGVDLGELRYSVGLGISWLTPVGPLTFSIAEPLNAKSDDDTQFFQFSLGQTF